MNDRDKQAVFQQQLDYITGRSNLNPKWPAWTKSDIEEFWGLQWAPHDYGSPATGTGL
jgi:hypothetical protein